MVSRKYIRDYRLESDLDGRGRWRTRAVYIGGNYGYVNPGLANRIAKRWMALYHVLCWTFFISALLPDSRALHTVYCAVPFVICGFPLMWQSFSVYVLIIAQEPFRRDQAEKISQRIPASALLAFIFSGLACAGFIVGVFYSEGSLYFGDAVFVSAAGAIAALSAILLRCSRRFVTCRLDDGQRPG